MSRSRKSPIRPPRPHFPLRTRFSRAAVPYWIGVVLVAALTTAVVASLLGRAVSAEARYGRTQPVAVARRSLAPGDAIGRGAVAIERWPKALVPDGALGALPAPDRVAVADIAKGEPLVSARLSGGGGQGATALIPPGRRALAVPLLVAGLPLRPGDRVDLLATPGGGDPSDLPLAPPDGPEFTATGRPAAGDTAVEVTTGAVVVAVADESVTVAVDTHDAPAVAVAITSGTVVVALTGPPG
jgi:Flp pilus assembly protein CpaB